jgi:hypothetical protein
MPFLTAIEARYHPDQREWELLSPLSYRYRTGEVITVPAGVRTDLASTRNVPGFPSDGPYNAEAVLHDFLYQGEFIQRKKADEIFRYALIENKAVPRWQPQLMYIAVRLLGGMTFKKHTRVSIARARHLAGLEMDVDRRPLWPDNVMRFK